MPAGGEVPLGRGGAGEPGEVGQRPGGREERVLGAAPDAQPRGDRRIGVQQRLVFAPVGLVGEALASAQLRKTAGLSTATAAGRRRPATARA
ncbi:hypothetical protein [Kitasatospora sp. NPDC088346]|uniref:hypothetical protein n=1 Tax=Kitasatospora sp. NPDC088346 TaxID=3364073 RepID=UPI003802D238